VTALRLVLIALLLAAGAAQAQTAGEISFWESVRDSKNAVELQAYLNQYPNGTFAALAKARLAALGQAPAQPVPKAPVAAAPAAKPGELHAPRAGDTWTYRLSYPRLRGQWGQPNRAPATHAISVTSVADGAITDQLSVDGGTPVPSTHARGRALIVQGASIFSPYLVAFETLTATGRLGAIAITDPGCVRGYICEAKGRSAGRETVEVPAGRFVANKVIVDQEWRAQAISGSQAAQLNGGRTLTIWYAAEIGRAVKYSSRLVAGDQPPMDGNFDLELVSYQLK